MTDTAKLVEDMREQLEAWISEGCDSADAIARTEHWMEALTQSEARRKADVAEAWSDDISACPDDETTVIVAWPNSKFPNGWGYDLWAGDALHINQRQKREGTFKNAPHLQWHPTHWRMFKIEPPAIRAAQQETEHG